MLLSLGFNMFIYFSIFTVCFFFFFFPACLCASLVCVRVFCMTEHTEVHLWMLKLASVSYVGPQICASYILSSPVYCRHFSHCLSWFSWHHLSLSVYRRCIKYRSDCSIYLRKYISTQIQASVCIWSFTSNRRRQKANLHVGLSSAEHQRGVVQGEPRGWWRILSKLSAPSDPQLHHLTPSCATWPWLQYLTTWHEKSPLIS